MAYNGLDAPEMAGLQAFIERLLIGLRGNALFHGHVHIPVLVYTTFHVYMRMIYTCLCWALPMLV